MWKKKRYLLHKRIIGDEILKLSVSFVACTVENFDISFKDANNIAGRGMHEEKLSNVC